ncbi:MAG: TylF/MycF/NovP-related O-methyltransferase, partial [Chloroflexota bacterium]
AADKGDRLYELKGLTVTKDDVASHFERYDLLDDQVRFLEGWFKDTLPTAPIERLAVLRMDGDLYESTMDALNALYHKVSVGGYVIVDDYNAIAGCARAVDEFREAHSITDEMIKVDHHVVYWQKTQGIAPNPVPVQRVTTKPAPPAEKPRLRDMTAQELMNRAVGKVRHEARKLRGESDS